MDSEKAMTAQPTDGTIAPEGPRDQPRVVPTPPKRAEKVILLRCFTGEIKIRSDESPLWRSRRIQTIPTDGTQNELLETVDDERCTLVDLSTTRNTFRGRQ